MQFRSVSDLNRDVVAWAEQLPRDLDLVVGIPRSGLLAANLLALHLHLPLSDLRGFVRGRTLGGGERLGHIDDTAYLRDAKRILVVDDSLHAGGAMRRAKQELAGSPLLDRIEFGAVYVSPGPAKDELLDHWFEVVPQPRVFEWNALHHDALADACMDVDGVLCRDPTTDENDDGDRYAAFLDTVPVRLVPAAKVGHLVTARLERYRPQTEAWLDRAGIRYGQLHMHPAATAVERRADRSHATFKAAVYERTKAWLFIESEPHQAEEIANVTGRPVYCTDVRLMVYPGVPLQPRARPRRRDELRWRAQKFLANRKAVVRARLRGR